MSAIFLFFIDPFPKLFFVWVNPLISKGRRGNLHTSDDVYDLPDTLTVHNINSMFKARWDKEEKLKPGNVKLFRILRNCYGKEFLGIGGLKFLNDCSGINTISFLFILM